MAPLGGQRGILRVGRSVEWAWILFGLLTSCVMTIIVHTMKAEVVGMLGNWLRNLRNQRGETLREVAASAHMDPALLSKIERGNRLPTAGQVSGLARHFGVAEDELQAQRIAVDFLGRYGDSPFARRAVSIIRERFEHSGPDTDN